MRRPLACAALRLRQDTTPRRQNLTTRLDCFIPSDKKNPVLYLFLGRALLQCSREGSGAGRSRTDPQCVLPSLEPGTNLPVYWRPILTAGGEAQHGVDDVIQSLLMPGPPSLCYVLRIYSEYVAAKCIDSQVGLIEYRTRNKAVACSQILRIQESRYHRSRLRLYKPHFVVWDKNDRPCGLPNAIVRPEMTQVRLLTVGNRATEASFAVCWVCCLRFVFWMK